MGTAACLARAALWALAAGAPLLAAGGPGEPAEGISASSFGAVADGVADDTVAIENALRAAAGAAPGARRLHLPAGTYRYSRNIRVDGVQVFGDGEDRTLLEAADGGRSAWVLTGDHPSVKDLSIRFSRTPTGRNPRNSAVGVEADLASGFSILRVRVGPVNSAGIMIRRSGGAPGAPAEIRDCTVEGTLADGIHMTSLSHDIEVEGNHVRHTGDDFIAVVSYRADGGLCRDILIRDNVVADQSNGRGITVVGGERVTIEHNSIRRSSGAGVYLASEAGYDTYGDADIAVLGNELSEVTTNASQRHGAILLVGRTNPALLGPPLSVDGVRIEGNRVDGSTRSGIHIGAYSSHVLIVGNRIRNVRDCGISIYPKASDISVGTGAPGEAPNVISDCGEHGVEVDPAGSGGVLLIRGVRFAGLNSQGRGHVDAISIGPNSGFSRISCTGNRLDQEAGPRLTRMVESLSPGAEAAGNTSDVGIGDFISPR